MQMNEMELGAPPPPPPPPLWIEDDNHQLK